ncbi:GRB2-associated-binding protein 2 [Cricetulus griseus]|nr:GRB2-associated-binding protein 2 [Cricetulus griseus]
MSGDPDVLQYSKKPLQIISLNFCKQLDVGLTFNKKELQKSFMFDIKTNEHTFYLVSETDAEMNRDDIQIFGACIVSTVDNSSYWKTQGNLKFCSGGPTTSSFPHVGRQDLTTGKRSV